MFAILLHFPGRKARQSKLETHRFHIMVSKHWHSELCVIGTFEGFVEFAV